jgi:hypothetical protein
MTTFYVLFLAHVENYRFILKKNLIMTLKSKLEGKKKQVKVAIESNIFNFMLDLTVLVF